MIQQSHAKPHFRIRRSPLVWLGLLGFLFILWSWVDSMHRMGGIVRRAEIWETHPPTIPRSGWVGNYRSFYGHSAGYLRIHMVIPSSSALRIDAKKYEIWDSNHVSPDARWFPTPKIRRDEPWSFPSGASYTGMTFMLPHWIVCALYLTIWLGALAWRIRRVRRAVLQSQRVAP